MRVLALGLFAVGAVAESVTFLVSPDTHFTSAGGVLDIEKNARGVHDMNGLPGQSFPPASQWKGAVEKQIRGVVIPGDLVDDGCNTSPTAPGDPGCAEQWGNYTQFFKTLPAVATDEDSVVQSCRWPSFESFGNHDGGNSSDPKSGLVRRAVVARNRKRAATKGNAGAANYTTSPNGLHYSWDWGGVHFAMLGVYPGTVGDCAAPGQGMPGGGCCTDTGGGICWGWHSPEHSLEFLEADLARQDTSTPIVLFMHYGLSGFGTPGSVPWAGYSPDFWWSTREARTFGEAIKSHNIVAIVHGHTHACVFYQWDLTNLTGRVYDVYNAPALQKGGPQDPLTTPSQYLVFELDIDAGRFRAFQRVGSDWGKIMHEKPLNRTAPAVLQASAGLEKLQHSHDGVGTVHVRAMDTENIVPPHQVV